MPSQNTTVTDLQGLLKFVLQLGLKSDFFQDFCPGLKRRTSLPREDIAAEDFGPLMLRLGFRSDFSTRLQTRLYYKTYALSVVVVTHRNKKPVQVALHDYAAGTNGQTLATGRIAAHRGRRDSFLGARPRACEPHVCI